MNDRDADTDQERQAGLASVGATLAAAREEQQRSLESVAADLHLQPGGSFVGVGLWRPDTPTLKKIRDALVADFPGLTRDRQYGVGRIGSVPYIVVDTGGLSPDEVAWIEARDPTGFRWSAQGQILLDLPYAPPSRDEEHNDRLHQLINAALIWVVASKEPKGV